jgi:hypothetical protein
MAFRCIERFLKKFSGGETRDHFIKGRGRRTELRFRRAGFGYTDPADTIFKVLFLRSARNSSAFGFLGSAFRVSVSNSFSLASCLAGSVPAGRTQSAMIFSNMRRLYSLRIVYTALASP